MRRLYISFSILLFLLVVTTVAVAMFSINRIKLEAAQILVSSTRESLIVGDSRTAIMTLSKSVPILFKDISFRSSAGETLFSVKTEVESVGRLPLNLDIPLYQNTADTVKFGTLRFTYGVDDYIAPILLFLLIEFVLAVFAFKRERKLISKEISLNLETAMLDSREKIARQVAHDIRSPLTSLNIIIGKLKPHLSHETDVLRDVATRINGIADDLLVKDRNQRSEAKNLSVCFEIKESIEELVREKNISNSGIDFRLHLEGGSTTTVSKSEFQRIISNILNNAIESLNETKVIEITLHKGIGVSVVSITDHGSGIPQELLEKIGKVQISSKGDKGNGLGLYDTFRKIEEWGGHISIYSKVSIGTKIVIKVPEV